MSLCPALSGSGCGLHRKSRIIKLVRRTPTRTRKEGIARTVDTVDGRSVGIGIGLPTTFGGSGNARATETAFPPTEMRWRAVDGHGHDGLKLGPQQEPRQWCCTLDMPWRPLHFLVNRNHANRFALLALLWPTRPTTQRQRQRERWIVRWCGVELPTCQPDSSSSGIIGLPQCLDYSHYLIRFESSHGRRPTGGQVQNGATARMVEVWLPVPTNCRQRVKREKASAKSCGNYIGHSARLAAWLAKWICY